MNLGSMSMMLRCALDTCRIFSAFSVDSIGPPFSSAGYDYTGSIYSTVVGIVDTTAFTARVQHAAQLLYNRQY